MKFNQTRLFSTVSLLLLSTYLLKAQDAASAPAPITPAQAAHKAADARQKGILYANEAISDGQRFLASGNYDQAAGRFQFALDSLSPGGVTATSYHRAEIGMAQAKEGQAKAFAKDDKFAQANTLLQQASVLDPNNPAYPADIEELKREQLAYEAQVRDPEGTTVNPAVTDDFKARVAAVQKLLFQGDAYFRTGQYDKSEETYSKALIIDPYNKAARDKMDHIERYRNRADQFRHEEYESKWMEQIDHAWSQEISTDIVAAANTGDGAKQADSNRVKIERKLSSIIIDKVNFEKLDIAAVIQFLQEKSKELDPDHEGVNFVLRLSTETPPPAATAPGAPAATPAAPDATAGSPDAAAGSPDQNAPAPPRAIRREVSITLENVPLANVLQYIVNQTNLQFTVEDYAVYLRPSIDEGETLSVRTFLVPPNFFEGSSLNVTLGDTTDETTTTVSSLSTDAQKALIDKGIRFPAGATAVFLPGSSKLVVRDTPEQLDLIANLIEQESREGPQQIQIEAKLAEFNQDAIKELNFNYALGNTGTVSGDFARANLIGVNTALRTADAPDQSLVGGLTPDGITQLIDQNVAVTGGILPTNPLTAGSVQNNAASILNVGVVLDHEAVQMVMSAINNVQGVSLLSAPSVTTQNGLRANIDIVQEFPYPTSFDKPQLSNSDNLSYDSTGTSTGTLSPLSTLHQLILAVPPTPREFVTQDVGVSLEVRPTTYPDQRIDLDISKAQVDDFDGFINYGVPIVTRAAEDVPPPNEPGIVLTAGTINQPVFELRSMVTDLQVLDGQTAVLGGLVNESTQEINDKVPVLGDLPIIGRLFQSKISERTKKSLIFFITARLIKANGKPQYVRTLEAEPQEETLPEPDQQLGPAGAGDLPPLPAETPNS
jgi:general secretion pathway protein D